MTEKEIRGNIELAAKVIKEHRQELLDEVARDFERSETLMKELGIDLDTKAQMSDYMTLYNMEAPEGYDCLTLAVSINADCIPEFMEVFKEIDNGTADFSDLFDDLKI